MVASDLEVGDEKGFVDDERWWEPTLAERRLVHQLEPGESLDCSWPECAWHGVLPGEVNLVHEASPP